MHIPRLYQPMALVEGQQIMLGAQAAHHVIHVLRLLPDAEVIVFNGEGGEFAGILSVIEKKKAWVQLTKHHPIERESSLQLHLGQGISRGEKMDFTLQKAVELGVSKVTPLWTERCNVKLDAARLEKRMHHWQGIIISACEQSGRNKIPQLERPQHFLDWVMATKPELGIVLTPNASLNLSTIPTKNPKSIVFAAGSEGGFTEEEIQCATRHGFFGVNLGPRILRTETAALAALVALQCQFGDMGG